MGEFTNQGPVPFTSDAYVHRDFETEVFRAVAAGEWVLLLGPRQHGKTSGLMRLRSQLVESGFKVARIELEGLPPYNTYRDLLLQVSKKLSRQMFVDCREPAGADQEELLTWLSLVFENTTDPVVVVIDEAASISDAVFRNSFYGQIRQIRSMQADCIPGSLEARLRFVFSGTFRPDCLVHEQNSPFNVCRPIYTDDLTIDQAIALARMTDIAAVDIVQRVYDQVGGQPYLIQTVLKETMLQSDTPPDDALDNVLENLQRIVSSHLQSLFRRVVDSESLCIKIADLSGRGSMPLRPADSDCEFLQVVGLVRREGANLVFRNRLYEEVARQMPQLGQQHAAIAATPRIVVPVELDHFRFMDNADLQQIACSSFNGGVAAFTASCYRIALVGFGATLETILLDLLCRISPGDLQSAITSASQDRDTSKRPHFIVSENSGDPNTWRLVNLINISRKVGRHGRQLDPTHLLREWRNLIHPALALTSHIDEMQLEPEIMQAVGILQGLRRDIAALFNITL